MLERLRALGGVRGYGLLATAMGLLGVAMSASAPYLALYFTTDVGLTAGEFGLLMAVAAVSGVVVSTLVARASDRLEERRGLIALAAVAGAVEMLAFLVVRSFVPLLVVTALLAAAAAPSMPQIFAAAHDTVADSGGVEPTFAASALRSLFSLGFVLGPLTGAAALAVAGYRGVLLVSAAFSLLVGAVAWQLPRPRADRPELPPRVQASPPPRPAASVLWPFAAFFLLFVTSWIYQLDMPLYLVHTLHGRAGDVGVMVSFSAALEIPLMIGLGALAGRLTSATLVVWGCLAGGAYYLLIALTTHLWVMFAGQVVEATFISLLMGIGIGYFQDRLPQAAGVATTVYSNAQSTARVVGSLAGGFLAQTVGLREVFWICLALALAAFALLALSDRAVLPVRGRRLGARPANASGVGPMDA